jgi:hypothetical protein
MISTEDFAQDLEIAEYWPSAFCRLAANWQFGVNDAYGSGGDFDFVTNITNLNGRY